MGRVSTNNTSIEYTREESLGVLPTSPVWHLIEANDISTYGASISTVARNPISKDRQGRKGAITDLDSTVELPVDVTMSAIDEFVPPFLFSSWSDIGEFTSTEITGSGITVSANGDLAEGTLVNIVGSIYSENNGLKVVEAGSTTTNIAITGLTPATGDDIKVMVAGVRGAEDDIVITDASTISSTTLDFTTLGIEVGSYIFVGGSETANHFATSTNAGVNYGFCRVRAVSANAITIDKTGGTFIADTGTGKSIDIYYGKFVSNVSTDSDKFAEQSYQFEIAYPNLGDSGDTGYEYAKGNYANQITLDFPLADKATMTPNFVGIDTTEPTFTRATGTHVSPFRRGAVNTSSDFARIRLVGDDASALSAYVKSLTLTINNNVSAEKVLGTLGAVFMNVGSLAVTSSMEVLFTSDQIVSAIRNNATLTLDVAVKNDDGAVVFDIPSLTLGNGSKVFSANETVRLTVDGTAFGDDVLNTSMGVTSMAYVPGDIAV